jgi:hypothetical protein
VQQVAGFLVGATRSQLRRFEPELLKEDWMNVRREVEFKPVGVPTGR